jgi:hypothetical protein
MSVLSTLRVRTLGAAAVAALAGVAVLPAAANAAAPLTVTSASAKATAPTASAHLSRSAVAAWQQFQVYGLTTHVKAGAELTLQQEQHGRWVSLPAVTTVTRNGSYELRAVLGLKGVNHLRVVGGGAVSNTVAISVR